MMRLPNTLSRNSSLSLKSAAWFALCTLIVACSSSPAKLLIGEKKEEETDDRVSVLALDESLEPDARFAGALIELPPSYANPSWAQPGGEADHTLHHLAAPLEFKKLWATKIGKASKKRARLTSPPIVVAGRVFVVDAAANVSAYNADTGKLEWRTSYTPKIKEKFRVREIFRGVNEAEIGFGGGVAYDEGQIFVTSGFGFVAALDAVSGEKKWQTETDGAVRTPPTAHNGMVFLTTNTNQFLALDQEKGEIQWTFQSFEEGARILSASSPAAAGDLVLAPFSSGELVAFISDTGRSIWRESTNRSISLTSLATLNDIAGSPVIDRGLAFVVSHAGRLAAIDLRSGRKLWEVPVASLQMPWVAGDYIFVMSVDAELVCVSREDGAVVWVSKMPRYKNEKKRKNRISWAGPVLAGDHLLVVSTEGDMLKLSPFDGEILDEVNVGSSVIAPVVADEKIFVLTENGVLVALR